MRVECIETCPRCKFTTRDVVGDGRVLASLIHHDSEINFPPVLLRGEVLYRLADLPVAQPWSAGSGAAVCQVNSFLVTDVTCANTSDALRALDYTHASSVSVGPASGDYYVALRNLNAVLRLARDKSGLVWCLSPTLTAYSNFTFAGGAGGAAGA